LGMIIEIQQNKCFVPLRSLINTEPKLKKASFPLPTTTRPQAGLDYRKLSIINDENYLIVQKNENFPKSKKENRGVFRADY